MINDNFIFYSSNDSYVEYLYIEYLYATDSDLTFHIKVKSGDFSGGYNFCISRDEIVGLITILKEIENNLSIAFSINDSDSDSFISFKLKNLGHVDVFGRIGATFDDHSMTFKYTIDQTIFNKLLNTFELAIQN